MTTQELNRTDLTAYETATIHELRQAASANSLTIGAYIVSGSNGLGFTGSELFATLLERLIADSNLRDGALAYARFMAEDRANQNRTSQAAQLQARFIARLTSRALAARAAKAGA